MNDSTSFNVTVGFIAYVGLDPGDDPIRNVREHLGDILRPVSEESGVLDITVSQDDDPTTYTWFMHTPGEVEVADREVLAPAKPVVVVVRHPDAENHAQVFGGEVEVFDIDLGSGFDGTPDGKADAAEWAHGMLTSAEGLGKEAYDYVFSTVAETVSEHLDEADLRELAEAEDVPDRFYDES